MDIRNITKQDAGSNESSTITNYVLAATLVLFLLAPLFAFLNLFTREVFYKLEKFDVEPK